MHSISSMLDPGMQNQTKSVATTGNSKIDCAKECPCGVPVIPVPDQWLEVMVTGGFKVWHIIFIIIAFAVTLIVVYCCFHRCRIPRTKQEIEADLMRTNITNKFRDYLQALPNEPTSFLEALKKVQDLEEKSEKDDAEMARDAGARKRLGWLKLKGKGAGDKETGQTKNENGGEKSPEEKPLVAESEPQKTVIPPPEPATSVAPPAPAEPNIVDLLDPNNAEATLPKSPIGPATTTTTATEATATATTTGDQETKLRHQPRRRKQKPNLSRTKRARENPNGGDTKSPRSPQDLEPASNDRRAHAQAVEKPIALDRPPTSERIQPAPSRSHPPKHHAHRVRIESKMSPRPPDV